MNKTGRRGLSISALALCLYTPSFGETRRALLVGIDQYSRAPAGSSAALSDRSRARLAKVHGNPSRTSIAPLEGAVQDARDLAELLIRKFAFRPENVRVLVNSEATGDAILSGLEKFLVEPAAAGDVSLFFFAGHGSRIRNTATKNVSGLDSTILPADSLLGVPDLRSKELARIYLRAAARGIHMTVIQDSCFSGGGARGVVPGRKTRAQESDSNVSVTETLDRNPEEDGVLVLSASQDYQPAQEVQTETGSHGAFTWALLTAMETSGPNERVSRIFQRTRALMQSRVNDQEPAISLSSARVDRGLFAQPADSSPRGGTAAVGFVDHKTNLFELNSGITLGLHAGCELKRVVPSSPPVRIQIKQVNGPSSSNAALLSGDRDSVHGGDLFQLDKWVAPPQPVLRVFVGPGVAAEDLQQLHQLTGELGHTPGIGIVGDPSAVTADFVLLHDGEWKLASTGTEEVIIRSRSVPAFQDVIEAVKGSAASPRRIAVLVPPPAALAANLRSQFAGAASPVSEAESPQTADYVLVGSTHSGALEYAWLRPGETQSDMAKGRSTERDTHVPVWPLRSDWVNVSERQLSSLLAEHMAGLTRIAGWLRLRTPVPDDEFPYSAALQDAETGTLATTKLQGGRAYKLILQRDARPVRPSAEPRWVYIFVIDSYGKSTLVFPRGGTVGNLFPNERDPEGNLRFPREIAVTRNKSDIEVEAPFGVDNYFLLTTSQPIENPGEVFNVSGVRTRSGNTASSPLSRLIQSVGGGVRGAISGVPTNWSVDRLTMLSVPPAAATHEGSR